MQIRRLIKELIKKTGYTIVPVQSNPLDDHADIYDQDGLKTHHNHDFMKDPDFCRAYARGAKAADDYRIHWRVHIALWAASHAARLPGDFVECGVNYGFMSSAIMTFLNWDTLGKTFYLLDTFSGMDPRYISPEEAQAGILEKNRQHLQTGFYIEGVEAVRRNFSEWKNVRIIQGSVPDTLAQVDTASVAYLHLDMNCAPPEAAALQHFWKLMTPGAVALFDDYAYHGYEAQKAALDAVVKPWGVRIAALPTGQGVLLKPPQ
ncbi:macrocin O-methyltransferase [Fontisphaera persica]|uniref:TylF/MycF/NovP-related O-methyltransferase n=1 Tax=Fontisphaera persica TaxID=2974023 RepID=UPI0024C0E012|nr:TylF/MycF/NovP-related O-methyltransferase [Fontisphaera persica]WCJ58926.1 macrocin O-methyltransferase [Fontisphaera persica]